MKKIRVFCSHLFILLGLCAGLFGCEPNTLTSSTSTAEETSSSDSQKGVFTTIAHFQGDNGSNSLGLVRAEDGNFYGITESGRIGPGAIFRLTPDGQIQPVVHLNGETQGYNSKAELILGRNGNLYGTTGTAIGPEPPDPGIVFRLTLQGKLTPPGYFRGNNGIQPNSLIEIKNGTFYGTTLMGGNHNQGNVFKLTLDS